MVLEPSQDSLLLWWPLPWSQIILKIWKDGEPFSYLVLAFILLHGSCMWHLSMLDHCPLIPSQTPKVPRPKHRWQRNLKTHFLLREEKKNAAAETKVPIFEAFYNLMYCTTFLTVILIPISFLSIEVFLNMDICYTKSYDHAIPFRFYQIHKS